MHIPPSEGFLQLYPCLLPFHQKGENGLSALDPAPHSLNQHGLLAAPSNPFHDLAAEAALPEGTLQLHNNALVLACKVHHALAPALTLNVGENEALNNFACLESLLFGPFGDYHALLGLDLSRLVAKKPIQR